MVSEDFLLFFMSLMAANGPPGEVASNLNPRGMVGRIYVVNLYALLHTKH